MVWYLHTFKFQLYFEYWKNLRFEFTSKNKNIHKTLAMLQNEKINSSNKVLSVFNLSAIIDLHTSLLIFMM